MTETYELYLFKWSIISIRIHKIPDEQAQEVEERYNSKLEGYVKSREDRILQINEAVPRLSSDEDVNNG